MKKLLFIAGLLALTLSARAQDAVFITHPESAEAALAAADIKDILLGNITKWPRGPVIKLVVLTDGPVHAKVIKDYTQRTTEQFEKFWKRKVFTGAGIMPAQCQSDAEIIAYVASHPGALGYVAKTSLSDSDKVKILNPN